MRQMSAFAGSQQSPWRPQCRGRAVHPSASYHSATLRMTSTQAFTRPSTRSRGRHAVPGAGAGRLDRLLDRAVVVA
jgi:hypothetical protein